MMDEEEGREGEQQLGVMTTMIYNSNSNGGDDADADISVERYVRLQDRQGLAASIHPA